MTGVEILTSKEIVVETAYSWTAFWICAGIILALCIAFGLYNSMGENDYGHLFLGLLAGVVLGCLSGVIAAIAFSTPATYETQYDVIISPEVSMTEFYERYEVIEQDGRIFTIREK